MIRPTHPKLTQVTRVINDIFDVVGRPKGSCTESLCQFLYYLLIYRVQKENRPKVIWPTHQKLTQVPRVIHDVIDVVARP